MSSSNAERADLTGQSLAQPSDRQKWRTVVQKFLVTWVFYMIVLAGLALLVNIDWAKPYCQRALCAAFHRNVKIGHLTWTFGLNGLEIETSRMSVFDPDGKPFLLSGPSQIGLLFVPLLKKQFIISHFFFRRPELWAKRLHKNEWNLEDLFRFGPDIRYLEFQKGKLHISDNIEGQEAEWKQLDLDDVKLQFVWPHKQHKTPFQFSFKVPKDGYTTSFQISGLGSGELQNWQDNHYKFDVKAEKVDIDDFRSFIRAISERVDNGVASQNQLDDHQLKGLFDFKIDAEGVLSKGLTAFIKAEGEHLSFGAPTLGMLKANEATTEATVTMDKKKIEWTDTVTRVANIEIKSRGELLDWREKDSQYAANLDSNVDDLSKLGKLITPDQKGSTENNINIDPSKLTGKAEIEMKILGDSSRSSMMTDLKTPGLSIEDIVAKLPSALSPAVCLMGLSKNSQVQGEIKFVPDERLEITNGRIAVPGGTLETTGQALLKEDKAQFKFQARSIRLKDAERHLAQSDEEFEAVSRMIYLPNKHSLVLGGTMDLQGMLDTFKSGHQTRGQAQLSNAQFGLKDGSLSAKKMNGVMKWTDYLLTIDRLTGTMGDGTFKLAGSIKLVGEGDLDLVMQSHHLDLSQLRALLRVLKIQLPVFSEQRLYGRVHDLTIKITGSRTSPLVYFTAVPEDLSYRLAGMSRPLRATSGLIVYDRDRLDLKDVGFVTHGDKVITTLSISDLSKTAKVSEIKVKTDGIDLADVHFYLSSPVLPAALKKTYTDFLKQYKIANVHGRAYGDALCRLQKDKIFLDGVIGLNDVGARIGDSSFPIEHLKGTLSASGDELLMKEMTGSLHDSSFTVNGQVDDYQSDHPKWRTALRAALEPDDLLGLVPSLSDALNKQEIKITAGGPLVVNAQVSGNNDHTDIVFAFSSEAANHLVLSGHFGAIHQPAGEPLVFDGAISMDKSEIQVASTNLLLGDAPLQASGSIKWVEKAKDGSALPSNMDMTNSEVAIQVRSPKPMPARTLLSMIDPSIANDAITGVVDGYIGVTGTLASPRADGKIVFSKISVPKYELHDLNGKIELVETNKESTVQRARLDFPSIRLGDLQATGIEANLRFEPSQGRMKQPKIAIENGHAEMGGGEVTLNGWLLVDEHKLELTTKLDGVRAADLSGELLGHPGELTGLVDADVNLDTEGGDYKEAVSKLSGNGQVVIHNGTVTRFGQLQTKLTQVNLLHQGIFGFNLNNLLQSVVPVRTGRFKELSSDFRVDQGVLYIDHLRYKGDDMRLWGSGRANLPRNTLTIEVAGKIPRVSSSFLGGAFGEVSRAFTIQKMMNVVTRGQLEALPSLPLLGDIAADKPRIFTFKVSSQLDQPKTVAQSIEKSFHWLPSRPTASAHPVPGLND